MMILVKMNLDINLKTIIIIMEMIITRVMIESLKETIKENNVMYDMTKFIFASIAKEAKEDKKVSESQLDEIK